MSAGSSSAAADDKYRCLVGALEWTLPDPITPDQVVVKKDAQARSGAPTLINVGASQLSGHEHMRSFRAFPSAVAPRILYPAETPFRRFKPILHLRVELRLKAAAVRVLSSLPLVIDKLSHHVVLGTERESALSGTVHEFSEPLNTAIYVAYRDTLPRPTIWGFDERGTVKTIAKYASGVVDQQALDNEYQVITRLNEIPRLVGRVPALYRYEHGHLGSMMVTDAFEGSPGPLTINASIHAWLNDCIIGPEVPAIASPLLQGMEKQVMEHGGVLETAFRMAHVELEAVTVPMTVVHGDFAPWNIFIRNDIVHVFDWETGILNGIPEWDKIFYTLRGGLIVRDWSKSRLRREIGLLDRQGSPYYQSSGWRALISLSLVNLLLLEYRIGETTGTARKLQSVLGDIVSSWWE